MNNIPDPKNIRNISLRELFGIPIPNPSPERKEDTPHCDNWKTWGRTITREDCVGAISCSIYGRLTWPNLGVNLPTGAAISLSCSNALWRQRQLTKLEKQKIEDDLSILYSEVREKLLWDDKNV